MKKITFRVGIYIAYPKFLLQSNNLVYLAKKTKMKDPLWFKDAIIYECPVKSFKDSNSDGIGDFRGLIEKLDYIQQLGITAIWILPFFPSPLRDDGYDIQDYYTVNPIYGDVEDFRDFVAAAKQRDIKVIIELVINHCSDQHPLFQRAIKAPKDSNHRNYFVWSDDPDKYNEVRIIFTDSEKSNWTWNEEAGQYYWHRFFHHQPDLNFDNPEVQEEIFKVLDFWAAFGVDGFRLDAIPYLFERDHTSGENLPETHDFLKKLRAYIDSKHKDIMLLAEANMWPEDTVAYFGEGDECHMNFHFPVMPRLYMAMKRMDRSPIIEILKRTPAIPESCQWATFLRNHDELTLEMVTLEDRHFMWDQYAADHRARINLGIRLRLARLMDNDRRKIELMNVLLFSLPGTPVLYYGDEIGMGDDVTQDDRNGVRTPMQWNDQKNGGFSDANPDQLYLPMIPDPEYHFSKINVADQTADEHSLFHWMKRIISLRKELIVLGRGDIQFFDLENQSILAFTRSYTDEKLLVVINLSDAEQEVVLDLADVDSSSLLELFSKKEYLLVENRFQEKMSAFDYLWFRY
ncbi:MAG: maltose alpha-D-glucosyltransferase/alpha-amylase [Saprospiraceae bacterium]